MHHALFAVHPDMRLQTEVPLLSLPGLMHLRVALAGLVLGGGRRMDNGRIHDRTRRNADALGLQMHVHSLQHQTAQFVLLQQMAEAADGCLVRRRRNPEIHANESAQRCRFVQRLFHPGIRQVEPLLNKVRPQHDREAHRLPSVTRLRVVRTHQSLHRRPRNYTLHLLQKQLPPTLPTVLLKHRLTCQTLLLHPVHLATIRLINQAADAELVQRFLREDTATARAVWLGDCRIAYSELATVDSRTTRLHGMQSFFAVPLYRFSMRSSRSFAASKPCFAIGCSTVVSGGVVNAASGMLSKP